MAVASPLFGKMVALTAVAPAAPPPAQQAHARHGMVLQCCRTAASCRLLLCGMLVEHSVRRRHRKGEVAAAAATRTGTVLVAEQYQGTAKGAAAGAVEVVAAEAGFVQHVQQVEHFNSG